MNGKGVNILQWNAQGLHSHGNELEKFLFDLEQKTQVICVQETWFTNENFTLNNYECFSKNRNNGQRGGIAIYVQENIFVSSHEHITYDGIETEIQKLTCVINGLNLSIINVYNPCKTFTRKTMEILRKNIDENTIICGDFNSHNVIWGSDKTDKNGRIVEDS